MTTEILDQYQDASTGLGLVDGKFRSELQDNTKPTIHPPRKSPLSFMPKLKEMQQKLKEIDAISKVNKVTNWVNSLVIFKKKGSSLRLCLHPKDLNKSMKREHYKPLMAETISSKETNLKKYVHIQYTFWTVQVHENAIWNLHNEW